MSNITELIAENSAYIEKCLEEAVGADVIGDNGLADAMRYSLLGGGKRIRAFLVRYFCRAFGGCDEASRDFCCAVEMMHASSLIHDDLPCMDDDSMRRGKPSCHVAFGEAEALLAGDTLMIRSFETAAANIAVSDRSARLATAELAKGTGALGMCLGQHYDIDGKFSDLSSLKAMQDLKTGALIRTAALMGYYAACDEHDEAVKAKISTYAENIGFAFQITDDILDATADESVLGKPVGSDAKNNKTTVLSFMSIAEAEELARKLTADAVSAVADFDSDGVLADLAEYLLTRKK